MHKDHTPKSESKPSPEQFIDTMTEDDMVLLLRAAILRAKTGGTEAARLFEIKQLLLS